MVVIKKATFGDEFDSTDVMKTVTEKLKEGSIDLYVDSSIIPWVDKATNAKTTSLSSDDKQEIKDTVAEMCGPSDQICMEVKTQELVKARLAQKEATKNSSTTQVIKGRRLTVTYTDKGGAERTVVVPEGQQFQLGDIGKKKPGIIPPIDMSPGAAKQFFDSWWKIVGAAVAAFLWVSSVIITWMTYIKYGSKVVAAGMVAIAVFIPYSGFALSFVGPFIREYMRVDKLSRMRATMPEELEAITKADASLLPNVGKGIIPSAPPVMGDPTPLSASMKGGNILSRRK